MNKLRAWWLRTVWRRFAPDQFIRLEMEKPPYIWSLWILPCGRVLTYVGRNWWML